jgi:F0F1-type ATP synthase membrane subunit b/b'
MQVFSTLGLNVTIWYQFVIFLVAFVLLYKMTFLPYMKAFNSRRGLTEGNEDIAVKLNEQTKEVTTHFENKARQLNDKIKEIFDKAKLESDHEYDQVVSAAKKEAEIVAQKSEQNLANQINQAKSILIKDSEEVSKIIRSKMLGKDFK